MMRTRPLVAALIFGLLVSSCRSHAQQPQTPPVDVPPVDVPPVIAPPLPVKPDADDPVVPTPDPLTKPFAIVATSRGAVLGDLIARPEVGHLLKLTLEGLPESADPVFWTYSEVIPDRDERDGGKWVGLSFPPDVAGKAYLIQAAVNGEAGKPPLVAMRWLVVAGVAPQPPPDKPVEPAPTPVKPTPVEPAPSTVTAVTYVFEKDDTAPPNGVRVALNRLNRERKIIATEFEQNTFDGDEEIPDQYKAALTAAKQNGLPSLVVLADSTVLRVVKAPKTEAEVMEAAK